LTEDTDTAFVAHWGLRWCSGATLNSIRVYEKSSRQHATSVAESGHDVTTVTHTGQLQLFTSAGAF
jgi:hypothetical protein